MQIVLCSDNRVLAERLGLAVGAEFITYCVSTEEQLFDVFAAGEIAVIVLDARIVDHASALCMRLRANTDVPILAIAHGRDVTERVRLLAAGADDVLAWPFEMAELVARVHAKLRWFLTRQQTSDASRATGGGHA